GKREVLRVLQQEADNVDVRLGQHDHAEWIQLRPRERVVQLAGATDGALDQVPVSAFVQRKHLVAEPYCGRSRAGLGAFEDESAQEKILLGLHSLRGKQVGRVYRNQVASAPVTKQEGAGRVGNVPQLVRVNRYGVRMLERMERLHSPLVRPGTFRGRTQLLNGAPRAVFTPHYGRCVPAI